MTHDNVHTIDESKRSGPFWDSVAGRKPLPPAAAKLGLEVIAADVEAGTIEVAMTATETFAIGPPGPRLRPWPSG